MSKNIHKTKDIDLLVTTLGISLILILNLFLYLFRGNSKFISSFIILSFLPFLAFLIYYFIRSNRITPICKIQKLDTKYFYFSSILFFLINALSLISVIFDYEPYHRPVLFFILISFNVVIISIDILYFSNTKKAIYIILGKVVFMGLLLRLTPLAVIPDLYRADSWYHQMFTQKILQDFHLPLNEQYSPFPLMHLTIIFLTNITGFGFKYSSIFSVTAMEAVLVPCFLYLLTFEISHDNKISLYSPLLYSFLDIPMGFSIVGAFPTVFTTPIVLAIVYFLFKKDMSYQFLTVLLLLVLILSHSLTSLFLLLFFLFLISATKFLSKFFYTKIDLSLSLNKLLLLSILVFGYWMFNVNFIFSRLVRVIFLSELRNTMLTNIGSQYSQTVPTSEYLLSFLGAFIFISLSIIGFLYCTATFRENPRRFVFILSSLFPFIFGAFFVLILSVGTAPERWLYYSYIFLPITASFGIQFLLNSIHSDVKKVTLLSLTMIVFSFFMISSPFSNLDSPIYSKDITIQQYITCEELQSINSISEKYNGKIGRDSLLGYYLSFIKNKDGEQINYYSGNFTEYDNMLILILEHYKDKPIGSQGMYRLTYDPFKVLTEQGFSRIYDSEKITAFKRF